MSGERLVVGDFNINVNCLNDRNADKFRAVLDALGLGQLVTEPTHDGGRTLDLVITRQDETVLVTNLQVKPLYLSDHDTISINLPWKKPTSTKKKVKTCLLYTSPSPRDS